MRKVYSTSRTISFIVNGDLAFAHPLAQTTNDPTSRTCHLPTKGSPVGRIHIHRTHHCTHTCDYPTDTGCHQQPTLGTRHR